MQSQSDARLNAAANFSQLVQALGSVRFKPTKKDLSRAASKNSFDFALTAAADDVRAVLALECDPMVLAGTIEKPQRGRLISVLAAVRGEFSLSIRNWSAAVKAGEFLIFDPTYHPFVLLVQKRASLLVITVPTEVFFTHAGFLFDDLPQQAFTGTAPRVRAFAGVAAAFYGSQGDLSEAERLELSDSVLGFLRPVLKDFCASPQPRRGHMKDAVRQRALAVMAAHLRERSLTLEAIARESGVSPRYLCSAFEATGSSVMEHLYNLRVRSAAVHLQQTHMRAKTIREIALMNVFATPQHFARIFKRKFGMSPGEWRSKGEEGKN